jgi:hypothetical protein
MKSGRPNRTRALAIAKRDAEIMKMEKANYPRDFIAAFAGIKESRLTQIINKGREKKNNTDGPQQNEVAGNLKK